MVSDGESHFAILLYGRVMRTSLAASTFDALVRNYMNLSIWCVVGYGRAIYILK